MVPPTAPRCPHGPPGRVYIAITVLMTVQGPDVVSVEAVPVL